MAAVTAAATMTAPQTATGSHPYTCNTCQVAFKGSELQRGHMQSDWHRYNLKRRVASLPPLTSEIFAEKVLANQASAAATAARASFEKVCAVCQRTYFSENAYQNHLQSQKHKARLLQLSEGHDLEIEGETESMVSSAFSLGESVEMPTRPRHEDEGSELEVQRLSEGMNHTSIRTASKQTSSSASAVSATPASTEGGASAGAAEPTLQCLFCNILSLSITDNVIHMSKTHGLFVPEQAYLVDLPGLISYLHDRVHALHECLYCGQLKHTTTGIQTHMRDKGHCMIAFESEEEMIEVGQFYDFSSTYSDEEDGDGSDDSDYEFPSKTKVDRTKLGAPRQSTVADDEGEEEDEDWEDDDADENEDDGSDGEEADPKTFRPNRNQAYELDGELVLPSGRTAGHRSLARYFRQNLHNYPSAAERVAQQQLLEGTPSVATNSGNPRRDLMARGRSGREVVPRGGGGLGLLGASEETKRAAAKLEFKETKKAERAEKRYRAGNERRGNQQKHYRDPLLQ